MYELARKGLKAATDRGADEAEIFIMEDHKTSVDIRKDEIEGAKENISQGLGIRAIVNGAVGFASTNIISRIEDAAKSAVSSARVRDSDPDWKSLPSNGEYPRVSGIRDPELEQMELDDCISCTVKMLEGAKSIRGIVVTSGSFSRGFGKRMVMNTNGVEIEERSTGISGFTDVITTGGSASTAYDFAISRTNDIDFLNIGKNAADLADSSKNGVSIEPQKTNVILHPFAFSDLIGNAFMPSIDADNVQKGRSNLIGRIGESIATEKVSIIDDGLLEGGIETGQADDEGVPSQRTTVIENGVFQSYLYDSYTAGKDGVKSTGNASRGSYFSTPSVGPRNFIVDHTGTDIIAKTDTGILVNSVIGAHTANSISGDFSVEARNAFMIKDGKIDKPIKSLMISGNIFDMLTKMNGAGKDVRKVGGIVTPSVSIEGMNVVG
ncbi:TldD/PmbA family protein [Methanolobus halotolerans]|uniref:TldD/PmbA family protein n=1 Tax=Methanolobus halotolerans TaxID=2052935 RepID=A0A4E0R2H0_9EURY|nr:TldD/PmbA family protein [Methanolobus halotolerans]TGC11603.1 TldD/PmbA family protein [Methanolobus halotolerans]